MAQWWKVQNLPTGEVQLTLYPGASPKLGQMVTRTALALILACCLVALVMRAPGIALFPAVFIGFWAWVLRTFFPAEQVWLLRPGFATRWIAGEEGEATFEVASVMLKRVQTYGSPSYLQAFLVGPARNLKIGQGRSGSRSTAECEALVRTLADALVVPMVRKRC